MIDQWFDPHRCTDPKVNEQFKKQRESRVRYSLVHIGSAITMAALTTFLSGETFCHCFLWLVLKLEVIIDYGSAFVTCGNEIESKGVQFPGRDAPDKISWGG